MSKGSQVCFLVVRGPDLGARVVVGDTPRVIGRARDVDLVLSDPRVSRRHVEVTAHAGGASVRLCPGAVPFVIGEQVSETAEVSVGDQIILGSTVLSIVAAPAESERETPDAGASDIRTLLTGTAMDVRGLAGVFALVEALDGASTQADALEIVAQWARLHAAATETAFASTEDADETMAAKGSNDLVVRADAHSGASTVMVPAHTSSPGWVTFRLGLAPREITDSVRRLLVVAGRMFASRLMQLDAMRAVEEDRESFRRHAVGSAHAFLGASRAAEQLARVIPRLATSEVIVLLTGETGSGKTFVARLIHEASPRVGAPMRVINCAAIPENLIESELFGHERGAFTGAIASRPGALESAGHGTVLLDEIGELPLASQAKLLHVIEERRFERVGSNKTIALNARILAATNRDLDAMVAAGTFRSDLYFRISVVNVRVPPLRERVEDLESLAQGILSDLAPSAGRRVKGFSPSALEMMRRYPWPGNVRELRNAVEHALVLGDAQRIEPEDLPAFLHATAVVDNTSDDPSMVRLPATLASLEERAIDAALRATGGNRARAAVLLGINRATLYNKLRDPNRPPSR